MEVIFLQTPYCCQACKKQVNEAVSLKKCNSWKCAHYCDQTCQHADWAQHKKYCKKLLYLQQSDIPAFKQAKRSANKQSSDMYKAAHQAVQGTPVASCIELTATAAEAFVTYCLEDIPPTCEQDERVWGLRGDPQSPDYQRLLMAYQQALWYTDLNAQKLMECLLARPHAGKALTQALQDVKFVQIRGDSYEQSVRMIDRWEVLVADLEVDSEFDRWPVGPDGPPAAQ